jgi:hypothetical protein
MLGPSTDSTAPQFTAKVTKRYAVFVIALSLSLVTLCTVVDHIRPIDSGPTGRFGPRVWLYEPPGTWNGYGGDNQIVTSNNAGTKVFDLPVKEMFTSHERLWSPVVSGHWLAYEEQTPQAPMQIKVLNLDTGREIALGNGELGQGSPAISGNWVAFEERSPNDNEVSNIYAYDLSKGTRQPVAVEEGKVRCCPKVSKQWVIYLQVEAPWDSQRTSIELRAHSLTTGEDFSIGSVPAPNDASFGVFHALDNDKVVWVSYGPNWSKILHLYDLTRREDLILPSEPGYVGDVSITDKHQLVVVNNNGWKVINWSKPQPEAVALSWSGGSDYLRATGDYLVGKASRDLFVAQILP